MTSSPAAQSKRRLRFFPRRAGSGASRFMAAELASDIA
jgi:hypothetical protein